MPQRLPREVMRLVSRRIRALLVLLGVALLGGLLLAGGVGPQVAPETVEQVVGPSGTHSVATGEEVSTLLGGWTVAPWAYVVYAVLVLGLVLVFVWWRTRFLERRRAKLEAKVAERTREVRDQQRQLEAVNWELLHTNEQLHKTVEEKSTLLGVAAHDLKNPLFGIRALSEIVLENQELSPSVERKVRLIFESADNALDRIDELLASAAGSALQNVALEPVDVAALARLVTQSFEAQAERKQQSIRCRVPDDECVVEGDRDKLQEAVANLVSNALKYSPPGEAVDVFVHRKNGTVEVAVEDAGPGLSDADQKRMFAPFQRLTPNPTGGERSSGLGLYIVKQVVDLHEGAVEVDSAPGAGSTFRLRLRAITPDGEPVPYTVPSEPERA